MEEVMTLEEAKCVNRKEAFCVKEKYPFKIYSDKFTFKQQMSNTEWEFEDADGCRIDNFHFELEGWVFTKKEAEQQRLDLAIKELTKATNWAATLETLVNKLTEEI
jgi:hypothetical protein